MKKVWCLLFVSLLVFGIFLFNLDVSENSIILDNNKIIEKSYGSRSNSSGNIYYVSNTGHNSNNGLSEATAWQTITYAISQAKAGDTVYIKKGDYGGEELNIGSSSNSGTKGNPIIYEGYNSIPGDAPVDKANMPRLNHSDRKGTGLYMKLKSYIAIKNIYITFYIIIINYK